MEKDAANKYLDTLIHAIPDIIFFKDSDGCNDKKVITVALTVLEDITESFLTEEKYKALIRNTGDSLN